MERLKQRGDLNAKESKTGTTLKPRSCVEGCVGSAPWDILSLGVGVVSALERCVFDKERSRCDMVICSIYIYILCFLN